MCQPISFDIRQPRRRWLQPWMPAGASLGALSLLLVGGDGVCLYGALSGGLLGHTLPRLLRHERLHRWDWLSLGLGLALAALALTLMLSATLHAWRVSLCSCGRHL